MAKYIDEVILVDDGSIHLQRIDPFSFEPEGVVNFSVRHDLQEIRFQVAYLSGTGTTIPFGKHQPVIGLQTFGAQIHHQVP